MKMQTSTKLKHQKILADVSKKYFLYLDDYALFLASVRRIAEMSRDFLRDAVFAFIIPRFAALSIALYVAGISFSASDTPLETRAFFKVLTVSANALLRRILKIRFLDEALFAFFAEDVIAMQKILRDKSQKCNFLYRLILFETPQTSCGSVRIHLYDSNH